MRWLIHKASAEEMPFGHLTDGVRLTGELEGEAGKVEPVVKLDIRPLPKLGRTNSEPAGPAVAE